MFKKKAGEDLDRFFNFWDFFQANIFSTINCLRLVKCVDSDESLNHCCGLKGHSLPLRPHIMPGRANDGAKSLKVKKKYVKICSYKFYRHQVRYLLVWYAKVNLPPLCISGYGDFFILSLIRRISPLKVVTRTAEHPVDATFINLVRTNRMTSVD